MGLVGERREARSRLAGMEVSKIASRLFIIELIDRIYELDHLVYVKLVALCFFLFIRHVESTPSIFFKVNKLPGAEVYPLKTDTKLRRRFLDSEFTQMDDYKS